MEVRRGGRKWVEPRSASQGATAAIARGLFALPGARHEVGDHPLVPPTAGGAAGFHPEFVEDFLHVFLHGALAEIQNRGDLAVAFAECDPSRHLGLTACQRMERGQGNRVNCVFVQTARLGAYSGSHGEGQLISRYRLRRNGGKHVVPRRALPAMPD